MYRMPRPIGRYSPDLALNRRKFWRRRRDEPIATSLTADTAFYTGWSVKVVPCAGLPEKFAPRSFSSARRLRAADRCAKWPLCWRAVRRRHEWRPDRPCRTGAKHQSTPDEILRGIRGLSVCGAQWSLSLPRLSARWILQAGRLSLSLPGRIHAGSHPAQWDLPGLALESSARSATGSGRCGRQIGCRFAPSQIASAFVIAEMSLAVVLFGQPV